MPKLRSVIESRITKGDGTKEKPYRKVLQYHSKSGKFLAEDDSIDSLLSIRAIQLDDALKETRKLLKEAKEQIAFMEDKESNDENYTEGWFDAVANIFMKNTDDDYGYGGSYLSARNGHGDVFITVKAEPVGDKITNDTVNVGQLLFFDTPKEAFDRFAVSFDKYMSDKVGPIDWRRIPTLTKSTESDKYTVSARLFARDIEKNHQKSE